MPSYIPVHAGKHAEIGQRERELKAMRKHARELEDELLALDEEQREKLAQVHGAQCWIWCRYCFDLPRTSVERVYSHP